MALLHQLCCSLHSPLVSKPSHHANTSPPSSLSFSNTQFSTLLFKTPSPLNPLTTHLNPPFAALNIQNPDTEVKEKEDASRRTRLIAQNVPWDSSAEDIRTLFEKYGTVLDVELSMHSKTRNRGLAFVKMGSPEEAVAALSNLESYEFEGRILKVNYARSEKKKPVPPAAPAPKSVSPYNLFIANLSYEARSKDVKEFFDTGTGKIVSAEIVFHDNPRKSSGYGFVSFRSKEDAEGALSAFQGKMFMGRPIRLARSKRFLKQGTEAKSQSDNVSTQLNHDGEAKQSVEVEEN